MAKEYPTLYKKAKNGKVHMWRTWAEGNKYYAEFGTVGGKLQVTENIAFAKNIGKSNGTTDEEQAEAEALSLFNHKKLKNYVEDLESTNAFIVSPMLAHRYDEHKNKVVYPCHAQPKLNGLRCLAYWVDDKIVLKSRDGKDYSCIHIKELLVSFLPKNMMFDGELYIHGETLETINSLVRREQPETKRIQYHVYDLFDFEKPNLTWQQRYKYLVRFFDRDGHVGFKAFIVEAWYIENEEELLARHEQFKKDKYEGTMARNFSGTYLHMYRSHDLLKVKDFKDEEYKVIGYKSGKGKYKDCVVWICEYGDKGDTFSVLPKGTIEYKKFLYENADQFIGKWLTVQYQDKTMKGKPSFPEGLHFRLDEDLPKHCT